MTKQETIAKAYGEHWETVKDFVDENGLIRYDNYKYFKLFLFDRMVAYDSKCVFWIPKSLKGIENNRGWNILKGMKNEIHHDGDIWILNKRGNIELWLESQFLPIGYATHWKPIVKPEPPIY